MSSSRFLLGFVVLSACSSDVFVVKADADGSFDSAMSDNYAPDAKPPEDAFVDASQPDAAEPPVNCAIPLPGTILCTMFENMGQPAVGWTTAFTVNGANSIDKSIWLSPSQSYLAEVPASNTPGASFASLMKEDKTGAYTTLALRASLRVITVDAEVLPVVSLSYAASSGNGTVDASIAIILDHLALIIFQPLADGGLDTSVTDLGAYQTGRWINLRLVLTPLKSVVDVFIDNNHATTSLKPLPAPFDNVRRAYVGITFANKRQNDNVVNFDDVLFRGSN